MQKILVRVLPRSSKNEVVGLMDNRVLKVKLTSPPVDGAANAALIKLLAKYFGVAKSDIQITQGENSQNKVIEIP